MGEPIRRRILPAGRRILRLLPIPGLLLALAGCSLFSVPFKVVKGTVTGGVWVV